MAKRGRPLKDIDIKQFEKLCALQCTLSEVASFFDCSEDTIERWCIRNYKMNFADVFSIKREAGRISLRRNQMKMSETNPTMAIWLGKQYLNQRDNRDIAIKQTISQEAIDAVEEFMNDETGTASTED